MKTEVKKIDRYKRKLSVEVGAEVVNKKFQDVYSRIAKDAQVPGFRKGKAPPDILEKHYKDLASQEVIKELIPEVYNKAIQKEALDVLNCLKIDEVKLDNNVLSFSAMLEVKPQINFKKEYKGIKVSYGHIQPTEEDVKRGLDSLKGSRKIDNIDVDFAHSLGYPAVEDLEGSVKRQIYLQKENNQRAKIEEEIIGCLMEIADFEIPISLVEKQLQELVERQKIELALRGVPKDKIEEQEKILRQNLEPQAKRQVKVYLILEGIAKRENIAIDNDMPGKVMEFLLKCADWQILKA